MWCGEDQFFTSVNSNNAKRYHLNTHAKLVEFNECKRILNSSLFVLTDKRVPSLGPEKKRQENTSIKPFMPSIP